VTSFASHEFCTALGISSLVTATERSNSWKSEWKSGTTITIFPIMDSFRPVTSLFLF